MSAQVLSRQETFESVVEAEFLNPNPNYTASLRGVLQELSIGSSQNKNRAIHPSSEVLSAAEGLELLQNLDFGKSTFSDADLVKSKLRARASRRRAAIEPETFEPLDAVQEESSSSMNTERSISPVCVESAVAQLWSSSDKGKLPLAPGSSSSLLENIFN